MNTRIPSPVTLDVQTILAQGRSDTCDWLLETASDEVLHLTLAAMANSHGGVLLIGAGQAANGPAVLGVSDEKAVTERLLQATLDLDPPLITPLPHVIRVDGRAVVALQIPEGMPNVYAYDGRYVHRQGGRNRALRPLAIRQLLIDRGEISFETEPARNATLDDMDWDRVHDYCKQLRVPEEDAYSLLHKRGCLTRRGEQYFPTNAGILLFGKDPQPHIRGAEITAVRFAGETMSDTFSRQDIVGTLPMQIRRAETFLIDHLRKDVSLRRSMAREEQYEYPMEAAREAVVNAVAHRDYSVEGDGIRLFLFKDRMEVNSPGTLPGPVTVDNIKDERFSRNPAIVQVLSDMGFIERLGYGIDRMIDLLQRSGLRAPEFAETSGGFHVKMFNQAVRMRPELSETPSPELLDLLADYADQTLNPRQEAALLHLRRPHISRITNKELQNMFPEVHAETIRRDLADLVTRRILKKMGQKRGSYYVLKGSEADVEEDEDSEVEAEISPDVGEGELPSAGGADEQPPTVDKNVDT